MTAKQNLHEFATLTVHEASEVGWCSRTQPNETVDADGNLKPSDLGFGVADPRCPARREYDNAQVEALREELRDNNGIRELEICEPGEIDRAVRIFHRDGFVVVRDLLDPDTLDRFRAGCVRVLRQILEIPGIDGRKYITESNRLPHRYSFGTASASRHLLHDEAWASMIDLPTTTPILKKIFGTPDYLVVGAGGDLCLPGAIEYQHLHGDIRETHEFPAARLQQAEQLGIELRMKDGTLDVRTQRLIIERLPPMVTINFLMSDLTWENGPIRQIPGSHASAANPPPPEEEPGWMRFSTLVGAPAGAGVFRDTRAWHGATPNLGRTVRAMPNVEYGAPWLPDLRPIEQTMPHAVWETLSPHAQHICRLVKAEPGVWPAGAGAMHPLAKERSRLKTEVKSPPNAPERET